MKARVLIINSDEFFNIHQFYIDSKNMNNHRKPSYLRILFMTFLLFVLHHIHISEQRMFWSSGSSESRAGRGELENPSIHPIWVSNCRFGQYEINKLDKLNERS